MRTLAIISLAAAAIVMVGCDSSGAPGPSLVNTSAEGTSSPVTSGGSDPQGCYSLSQIIPFSGCATITSSNAIGASGQLALGVVKSVINAPGSTNSAYFGSSSDGSITWNAQGTGTDSVQGLLQISQSAWDQVMSELPSASQYCVESMSFDLEVAQDSASQETLYGGQVLLTVNGTPVTLAF